MRKLTTVFTLLTAAVVGLAAATPALAAPVPVSASTGDAAAAEPSPEATAVWKQLQERYTEATVKQQGDLTVVAFADEDGNDYRYVLPNTGTAAGSGGSGMSPSYAWTWNSWELNRAETRELAIEGATAAIVYALAAAAGCSVCVVGALIEGNWAVQANNYYNRGHCAKIYFWLTINEYWGGNCR
jgi:hypothetical protein